MTQRKPLTAQERWALKLLARRHYVAKLRGRPELRELANAR